MNLKGKQLELKTFNKIDANCIFLFSFDPKSKKPSNIFGPKKKPSQSPYMRLLGRSLSQSEDAGNEGKQIETIQFEV